MKLTNRSLIVDRLRRIFGSNCPIVFAYLDYKDQPTRGVTPVLANLLKQLLQLFKPNLPNELKRDLNALQANIGSYQDNATDYIQLILRAANYFPTVFFIFDALDECEKNGLRWELLDCINALQNGGTNVKILITSRPHISLERLSSPPESIAIRANISDIECYIRAKLDLYHRMSAGLKEEIVKRLTSTAEGT